MNKFSCRKYRMARTLLLAALLLAGGSDGDDGAGNETGEPQAVGKRLLPALFRQGGQPGHDGLRTFRESDRSRLDALLKSETQSLADLPQSDEELMKLAQQMAMQDRSGNSGKRKQPATDFSASAQQKKRAEIEAQRKKALKQLDALPQSADKQKMVKEVNAAFDKMLAELGTHTAKGRKPPPKPQARHRRHPANLCRH